MRNGNPNLERNPVAPHDWSKSRFLQNRDDPYGMGKESQQGGVPQGPKINSIEGYGQRTQAAQMIPFIADRLQQRRARQRPNQPVKGLNY